MSVRVDPDTLVDPRFIGIPYRLNGRSFDGADCIGLTLLWFTAQELFAEVNVAVNANWSDEDPDRYLRELLDYGELVFSQDVRRNDVLLILDEVTRRFVATIAVVIDPSHYLITTKERGSRVGVFNQAVNRLIVGAVRPEFDAHGRLIKRPFKERQQIEQPCLPR